MRQNCLFGKAGVLSGIFFQVTASGDGASRRAEHRRPTNPAVHPRSDTAASKMSDHAPSREPGREFRRSNLPESMPHPFGTIPQKLAEA